MHCKQYFSDVIINIQKAKPKEIYYMCSVQCALISDSFNPIFVVTDKDKKKSRKKDYRFITLSSHYTTTAYTLFFLIFFSLFFCFYLLSNYYLQYFQCLVSVFIAVLQKLVNEIMFIKFMEESKHCTKGKTKKFFLPTWICVVCFVLS